MVSDKPNFIDFATVDQTNDVMVLDDLGVIGTSPGIGSRVPIRIRPSICDILIRSVLETVFENGNFVDIFPLDHVEFDRSAAGFFHR